MSAIEPRLMAIRGPLQGSVFTLPEGEFAAGRHSTNDVSLEDSAVSRRHCVITRTGDACRLRDLESRNGTFLNGTPVSEEKIAHRDEIRIGSSVFVYLERDDGLPAIAADSSTHELRLEDSLYLQSEDHTILAPSARALHDLRTLLRVSTMLHSFRGLHASHRTPAAEVLRNHLASLLLELIPGERGGVFVAGSPYGDWSPNPAVMQRIEAEQRAVWCEDADGNGLAVLAAPLMVRGEVAATVYVESAKPSLRFDEGHLQLITALAGMAAGAWENATILGWLQEENERLAQELRLETTWWASAPRSSNSSARWPRWPPPTRPF